MFDKIKEWAENHKDALETIEGFAILIGTTCIALSVGERMGIERGYRQGIENGYSNGIRDTSAAFLGHDN